MYSHHLKRLQEEKKRDSCKDNTETEMFILKSNEGAKDKKEGQLVERGETMYKPWVESEGNGLEGAK
jgi:hypothetical protein